MTREKQNQSSSHHIDLNKSQYLIMKSTGEEVEETKGRNIERVERNTETENQNKRLTSFARETDKKKRRNRNRRSKGQSNSRTTCRKILVDSSSNTSNRRQTRCSIPRNLTLIRWRLRVRLRLRRKRRSNCADSGSSIARCNN